MDKAPVITCIAIFATLFGSDSSFAQDFGRFGSDQIRFDPAFGASPTLTPSMVGPHADSTTPFIPKKESSALSGLTQEQIDVAVKAAPFSALSNAIYTGEEVSGWSKVPDFDRRDDKTGFHGAVYQSNDGKKIAVVFEGTTSPKDWRTDAAIAAALPTEQLDSAVVLAGDAAVRFKGKEIVVTGHSLGGALAQYAAGVLGLEAYTFNAAGLRGDYYERANRDGRITNLYEKGDVVSGIVNLPGGMERRGKSIEYNFYKLGGTLPGQIAEHFMEGFKDKIGEVASAAQLKKMEELSLNRPVVLEGAQYKETDALSSSGRPKVIDTTTNYFAVATVFSPSSGSAHLLTATGFQMRRDVSNTSASYDTGSGYSGSIGTASVVDQGSDASGGNLNWGRWSGAGSTNVAAGIAYTGQNFHYVYGSAPTNIPSSGSVTYNPVGGTSPTSSGGTNVAAGTAGTFNGGTIGVNFATRAVTVSNLNFSVSTATFNMNGSSTYNSNALFLGSLTGTCTGAACSGAVTGNHIGTLTGPAAAGIALGYQAHTTGTGMVVGAQGFKR